MRNIILILIIAIAGSAATYAGNTEKKYRKLIEKYDVADEAKSVPQNSPQEFWRAMLSNDERLHSFAEDMKKGRGAEKEAFEKLERIPRFNPKRDNRVISELQGKCDTLLMKMGITGVGIGCSLHVIYDNEPNAFAALKNEGFAICLTTGLLELEGINYSALMGYVAHEFAHGALMHHIRSLYARAKERRKNKLLGGIAVGLNAAAAGLEAYNAGAYGIPKSGVDYAGVIDNIERDVEISTLKYSFKYDREQEFEADLIAFRFLENIGCADDFIYGLLLLGADYDFLYSEYSDHPTTSSRIDFLKYVRSHPEYGNKSNGKIRKRKETEALYGEYP